MEQEPRTTGVTGETNRQPVIHVRHLVTIALWAFFALVVIQLFSSVKLVFLGTLAAGCITAALRPLTRKLPGPRVVRSMIVGLLPLVVIVGALFGLGYLISTHIKRELEQWPKIKARIDAQLVELSQRLGIDPPVHVQDLLVGTQNFFTGSGGEEMMKTTAMVATGVLLAGIFVIFGTLYLLVEKNCQIVDPILRLFPPAKRPLIDAALDNLEPRLRWWTIGTLTSMTIVGVLTYIGLSMIGIQMAAPIALVAAFAEIVPNVGPLIAFSFAALFAAAQEKLLAFCGVWAGIQLLESYAILPLVMRKAVKIPPFITFVSVVFWGKVFGIPGVLMALPINLLLWSFAEQFLLDRHERKAHGHQLEPVQNDSS